LPQAPIERLAVARLDGDMYESTMTAIEVPYPKLQPGGFLIVDDYGAVPACKRAIEDYRARCDITDPSKRSTGQDSTGASAEAPRALTALAPVWIQVASRRVGPFGLAGDATQAYCR
jgi:hypothetical protein